MREELLKSLEALKLGGVILYPTDSFWALGCDATNELAVARIIEIKKEIDNLSLSVKVDSAARVQLYVEDVPEMAWDLIELSDKALTIIYPKAKNLAKNLISTDGSIGICVTMDAFTKALCTQFRRPIVYTSASVSGAPTPSNFSQIAKDISNSADYVVNYRQSEKIEPSPSSIIKLGQGNVIQIIRA